MIIENWVTENKDNKILMNLYNNYIELMKEYTLDFFNGYDELENFEEYLLSHSVNEVQDRLLNDRYKKLKKIKLNNDNSEILKIKINYKNVYKI